MSPLTKVSAIAFAVSLALALVGVPLVRWLARRLGLLDQPGGRRAHAEPTVRLGGVAIVAAFVLPALAALFHASANTIDDPTPPFGVGVAWALLAGLLVMHVTGLLDDLLRERFPWWIKLGGQVLAATIAVEGGARLDLLIIPALNTVASIVWIVAIANAMNFLDHADGVCAGVAAIACLHFLGVALVLHQAAIALGLALLAGALTGFLVYNFPPAKIFMGDSGAHSIGYLLASFTLLESYVLPQSAWVLPALLPPIVLALPLFDLFVVVLARMRAGQPVHVGDRNHLHHRLRRLGMTDRQATLTVYLAALALGGGAMALPFATPVGALAILGQALATMGLIACLMTLGRSREQERAAGGGGATPRAPNDEA